MSSASYTDREIGEFHDFIVNSLGEHLEALNHTVQFPDKVNRNDTQPDIAIDGRVVVEVKVIKPSDEDLESDLKAIQDRHTSKMWSIGGTLNPAPVQRALRKAKKQLLARYEPVKIVALATPLELQMSKMRMIDILTGLDTVTIQRNGTSTKIIDHKKTSVPLNRKLVASIDAVLFLWGKDINNSVLWTLNDHDEPLYRSLTPDIENLWDRLKNTESTWL